MADVVNEVTVEGGLLVGHDGSAAASEAVRWAAGLAGELGEPLHVLRAWALLNAPQPASKSPRRLTLIEPAGERVEPRSHGERLLLAGERCFSVLDAAVARWLGPERNPFAQTGAIE